MAAAQACGAVSHAGFRLGQFQRELACGADGLVVALVGFDDALYQGVAHHVFFIELYEADAFHAFQNFHGVNQSAAAGVGQIDLRDVAVHHHFGVEALAREHHLHLLGRAVLRFVQDDEAVVEGAAAHESDGRDFDDVALQQFLHALVVEHVVERVVERAQIGVDFFLQRAGQEAEALAGFDGGAREDDARLPAC